MERRTQIHRQRKYVLRGKDKVWCILCCKKMDKLHNQVHAEAVKILLEEYQEVQEKLFGQLWEKISRDYQKLN